MGDPLNLTPHAAGQGQERMKYGQVSAAQPAPTTYTDPLYVVFPDYSTDFYWTVSDWVVGNGASLPQKGADCLIVFDNRGFARCVWWRGAYTTSAVAAPLGLPGATAATRYVGGTVSGAPASGTFAVGDFVIDQTGFVWICTAAGSPGTWVTPSAGKELAKAESTANYTVSFASSWSTATTYTGLSLTIPVSGSQAVFFEAELPAVLKDATTNIVSMVIVEDGTTGIAGTDVTIAGSAWGLVRASRSRTPSAGSHTYTVRAFLFNSGADTALSVGTGTSPAIVPYLRAVSC